MIGAYDNYFFFIGDRTVVAKMYKSVISLSYKYYQVTSLTSLNKMTNVGMTGL